MVIGDRALPYITVLLYHISQQILYIHAYHILFISVAALVIKLTLRGYVLCNHLGFVQAAGCGVGRLQSTLEGPASSSFLQLCTTLSALIVTGPANFRLTVFPPLLYDLHFQPIFHRLRSFRKPSDISVRWMPRASNIWARNFATFAQSLGLPTISAHSRNSCTLCNS